MKKKRCVYLAGPQVFFLNSEAFGKRMKGACELLGLVGLYPGDFIDGVDLKKSDSTPTLKVQAKKIYDACISNLKRSDFVIADITPFRGISADVGTAFEIGYARALGKPTVLYSNDSEIYRNKVAQGFSPFSGLSEERDVNENLVENFGLVDNLMITAGHKVFKSFEDALLYGLGPQL